MKLYNTSTPNLFHRTKQFYQKDHSEVPGTSDVCDRYWSASNYTNYIFFSAYEGLPECFLIDLAAFLFMLLVFSILRKKAWNYGRIALVNRMESKKLVDTSSKYNEWTSLFYGEKSVTASEQGADAASLDSFDIKLDLQDQGLFSWIPMLVRIKDEHILQKCGQDAVQYLTFQKYLIIYLIITTVVCMTVIFPLNYTQGNLEGSEQKFGRTTITNMNPNSSLFWVHCALGICLFCVAVVMMRIFTDRVHYKLDVEASKTLMISNISRDMCYNHLMVTHFEEAYPECPVEDIQFAYNVNLLIKLEFERQIVMEALMNSELAFLRSGQRPKMMPYVCGKVCCCRCCRKCGWKEVDAIEYYMEQLSMYQELCEAEKVNAFHEKLGIAFVTFYDEYLAARVKYDFRTSCKGSHNPMTSSVSRQLNAHNWEVSFAPSPDDIYWENLSVSPAVWWTRAIFVNLTVIALLFFLSTPSVVLNQFNRIQTFQKLTETNSNIVLQFVPTLLLVISSSILPVIVSSTDVNIIGHYTKSSLHHTVMRKVYVYMLIMVLMLPSMGFSSIGAVIEWFASSFQNTKFRWSCVFVSSNCAFFVNYIISTATIGIGMELLRIPDLLVYMLRMAMIKSNAEQSFVQKNVVTEFQYGVSYARKLCTFTVIMAYSIPCPLITVPGLIYHVLKYYTDKYNLCFVCQPSKIDNSVHESAISFVIVSVIFLQLTLFSFMILRADQVQGITIFAMVALIVTFILFCIRLCLAKLRPERPRSLDYYYQKISGSVQDSKQRGSSADGRKSSFLPIVLANAEDADASQPATGTPTYGTVRSSSPRHVDQASTSRAAQDLIVTQVNDSDRLRTVVSRKQQQF